MRTNLGAGTNDGDVEVEGAELASEDEVVLHVHHALGFELRQWVPRVSPVSTQPNKAHTEDKRRSDFLEP